MVDARISPRAGAGVGTEPPPRIFAPREVDGDVDNEGRVEGDDDCAVDSL